MLLSLFCVVGAVFVAAFLTLIAGLARAGGKPAPVGPWAMDSTTSEWSDRVRRDLARAHRLHAPMGPREPVQLALF